MAEKLQAVKGSRYSLHPAYARMGAIVEKMQEKTGKTITEWIAFVKDHGKADQKAREIQVWLQKEHKVTNNYAMTIAEYVKGTGGPENYRPEQIVDEQYSGKKEHMRPLYDTLLELSFALGEDVKACPCKTFVPIYRDHVIAQIKPTTNTRIDLGLALGDLEATGKLIDTGGFAKKDRITHRIPISSLKDIDDEVKQWLKEAYKKSSVS